MQKSKKGLTCRKSCPCVGCCGINLAPKSIRICSILGTKRPLPLPLSEVQGRGPIHPLCKHCALPMFYPSRKCCNFGPFCEHKQFKWWSVLPVHKSYMKVHSIQHVAKIIGHVGKKSVWNNCSIISYETIGFVNSPRNLFNVPCHAGVLKKVASNMPEHKNTCQFLSIWKVHLNKNWLYAHTKAVCISKRVQEKTYSVLNPTSFVPYASLPFTLKNSAFASRMAAVRRMAPPSLLS